MKSVPKAEANKYGLSDERNRCRKNCHGIVVLSSLSAKNKKRKCDKADNDEHISLNP
jgi:hypothetical protein